MFKALESDDYSFNFVDDGSDFNVNLNRVKELLSNAKKRAIEREKYYELLINNVKTGVITVSEDGNIHQANAEAKRMCGLEIFTKINQLRRIDAAMADAIMDVQPGQTKNVTMSTERGDISLNLTAAAITIDGRNLKVVSINDIGNVLDQKETDSWIKLTRVLTHEIMNSLAPVTSLSKTLIRLNPDKDGDIARGLNTICATSSSLISFVESYRKFTRLQSPSKRAFEVKPLIDKCISLITEVPEYSGILFSVSEEPENILIYADENLMDQVFTNLLKNAAQAVADTRHTVDGREAQVLKRGLVDVLIGYDAKKMVVITIANNGPDIPSDVAENIFTPFFTTKHDGSGIGLSISRQILNLHGGTLRLTQNIEGKVVFTIVL